ncbi:flagellar basal body-associated protein FliL [Sphingorhabdus sp. EL138]|jgi:flagellar FliL protein|uniref:flagellar basal body-associated FliL family protein n=1 Tax=Sphingorhabdus sp. EL138 TaxID=2073156 RepID=UPI000D699C6A|nr:flagellar basal body-associated FliL family protein [Sphingorhabdus sp. EL138]
MSDTNPEEEKPKKKKGKMKGIIIGLAAVAVLGGGGAAGGFYVAGTMNSEGGEPEDPNKPKIILKDGTAVSEREAKTAISEPNDSNFKITYHQIEQPFTSNLSNSESFAQLSLAISTYYDERVFEHVTEHEIAIRSAILMELGQQDPFELDTSEGKRELKKKLRDVINATLKEKSGFGGIEDVYFTSMVIQ